MPHLFGMASRISPVSTASFNAESVNWDTGFNPSGKYILFSGIHIASYLPFNGFSFR